jgi:uncharacterized protein (TIGR03435 family)
MPLSPRAFRAKSHAGIRIANHRGSDSLLRSRRHQILGRAVIDQTGLTGNYDILFEVPIGGDEDRESAIVAALEDQLGLALKRQTGTVDTISVDHVETPSEN